MSETAEETERRYTIAVDFDGVLNSYTSGWISADEIPDPPVKGAIEWLNEVAVVYDIVIHTTRAGHQGGNAAVGLWLAKHGFGFVDDVVITDKKLPALLYIDDRAWRFVGRFPSLGQIRGVRRRTGDEVRKPLVEKLRDKGQTIAELEQRNGALKRELGGLRDANKNRSRAALMFGFLTERQVIAMQAAWLEWKHGDGADHAMTWIENTLDGPDLLPDVAETGTNAQAFFDRETDESRSREREAELKLDAPDETVSEEATPPREMVR